MAAALGTALTIGALPHQALPAQTTTQASARRRVSSGIGRKVALIGTRYSRRTVAMDKRAAAKKRNQMRNKGR
jgi:hypothetical protein